MGKGDKRTRRGKISAGTFGRTRPHRAKTSGAKTKAGAAGTPVSSAGGVKGAVKKK